MVVGGTICIIGLMREGVSFVSGPSTVDKRDIVVPEGEDISCDSSIDFLGASDILEFFVVCYYDHLVTGTHE